MPSSTPVTVTFCGVSQFAVVNWIKLSTVASPVSDDVMERTTSELGCVFKTIAKRSVDPDSLTPVDPSVSVTVNPATSSSAVVTETV